jgi:hypothetical protein
MSTEPKAITGMPLATAIADDDLFELVKASESNKSLKNQRIAGLTLKSYVGGSGHVIQDDGTPLTQQPNLNFIGANVSDDSINNATVVEIPSGQKENIFFTKSGTISDPLDYMNKPGGISTASGARGMTFPYACVIKELYVEFQVTTFTTSGDLRFILDVTAGSPYRDISINAAGHYTSTNLISAETTVSKGTEYHVRSLRQSGSFVVEDVIVGVILEAT